MYHGGRLCPHTQTQDAGRPDRHTDFSGPAGGRYVLAVVQPVRSSPVHAEGQSFPLPQSAQSQLDAGATVYCQDTAYEVPPNSGLDQLLHTDQWTSTSAFQAEDADLVIHFGEFYELSLWSEGKAAFYDGYSGHSTKSYAYYTIPTGMVKDLITSLTALVPA